MLFKRKDNVEKRFMYILNHSSIEAAGKAEFQANFGFSMKIAPPVTSAL
jgi:hypothetical protein